MTHTLSMHAERRMRQRGVRFEDLVLLMDHADCEVPLPGGVVSMCFSKAALEGMRADGVGGSKLERLARLATVESTSGPRVLTVVKMYGRRALRHHRAA